MNPLYWVHHFATILEHDVFNLSHPIAAYMRPWIGSALVQVIACRLFGAKPLPGVMLAYCQLDSWEHISMKFELEFYNFHSKEFTGKCHQPIWRPFGLGGWINGWNSATFCTLLFMRHHSHIRLDMVDVDGLGPRTSATSMNTLLRRISGLP